MATAMSAAFVLREAEEAYRKRSKEFLSSHQLADFRKCPLLYRQKKSGMIADEDRPAYQIGRAAHTLILEGRACFKEHYAVGGPINPKTGAPYGTGTKAYAEWAEAQGRPVLTPEQAALVEAMAAGVQTNAEAQRLLASGIPEGVVRANYRGLDCQIRMDWFSADHGIVDLKTADDLTWFEADARRFGYVHQVAFYRSVLALVMGETPDSIPVHFIGVEKKQPYRCGVWLVAPESLRQAATENEAAMERLKQCERTGVWTTGYESKRVFDSF